MPLDPNIPLSVRPQQARSPLESAGRVITLQDMLQNRQIGQEQLKRTQLANQQDEKAIRDAESLDRYIRENPNATETQLLQNAGPRALPLIKARREQQKADVETQIKEMELNAKRVGRFGDIVGTIKDPQSYYVGIGQAVAEGVIDAEEGARYMGLPYEQVAPQLGQLATMALTRKEQLEQARKEAEETRAKADFEATLPGKQAESTTKQITAGQMQKQGMTDADKARLGQRQMQADLEAARNKETARHNRAVEGRMAQATAAGLNNAGMGLVLRVAGQFDNEPIVKNFNTLAESKAFVDSLGTGDKATSTDDQGLIYAFAKAMDPGSVVREGEYATVQRYAQSWANQFGFKVERVFKNAPFLSEDARKQIKATIAKKADVAKQQYDRVESEYGRRIEQLAPGAEGKKFLTNYAAPSSPATTPGMPPPPKKGAIVDGYVFLGGDPAQKSSWKKQ